MSKSPPHSQACVPKPSSRPHAGDTNSQRAPIVVMSIHKKFWADSTLLHRPQAHSEPLQAQSDPRGRRPHGIRAFIHMSMKNYILTHPLFLSPTPKYISQVVPPRPWGGGVCAGTIVPSTERIQGPGYSLLPSPSP